MKSSNIKNMTEGRPGRLILAFAVPLMAGNMFQQLYTVVDTMVVGKFLGVQALAALGAADWLNWMMLGIIQGRNHCKQFPSRRHYQTGKL